MLETIVVVSMILLAISVLACLFRVIKGPSMPDRIIALDTIGINIIGLVALLSIHLKTQAFFEIILLIGILAFIGTVAFSKYIERGVVIERKRD
ncbi:Na(+)/H(+) antiporter subunit F1 [Bacillus horti]|uniref:Multicomponent Na+:H+ antiporter subunit F n=1 Tax=Caldalkalibacillus horti TaxID=77523 RepID=A0ABT9VT28_9BACI|nr:Na(+)/H(+) antiporter subunit F1 [Bacillus horti]MDQ0164143.1 multicomponent Na+:H+ antiporter subunit F [Bacillus horti]